MPGSPGGAASRAATSASRSSTRCRRRSGADGTATEIATRAVAFARELGLEEVVGYAWTENPASIRVLEKAGLVFEREFEHAGLPHWLGRLRTS